MPIDNSGIEKINFRAPQQTQISTPAPSVAPQTKPNPAEEEKPKNTLKMLGVLGTAAVAIGGGLYFIKTRGSKKTPEIKTFKLDAVEFKKNSNIAMLKDSNEKFSGTISDAKAGNTFELIYKNGILQESTNTNKAGEKISKKFKYNENGKLTEVISGDKKIAYSYDEKGKITSAVSGDKKTEFAYDKDGKLSEMTKDGEKTSFSKEHEGKGKDEDIKPEDKKNEGEGAKLEIKESEGKSDDKGVNPGEAEPQKLTLEAEHQANTPVEWVKEYKFQDSSGNTKTVKMTLKGQPDTPLEDNQIARSEITIATKDRKTTLEETTKEYIWGKNAQGKRQLLKMDPTSKKYISPFGWCENIIKPFDRYKDLSAEKIQEAKNKLKLKKLNKQLSEYSNAYIQESIDKKAADAINKYLAENTDISPDMIDALIDSKVIEDIKLYHQMPYEEFKSRMDNLIKEMHLYNPENLENEFIETLRGEESRVVIPGYFTRKKQYSPEEIREILEQKDSPELF